MHGLIFAELKKYVETKFNPQTWEKLLDNAGLHGQLYLSSAVYPDKDILALVTAACAMTNLPAAAILEDFGEFVAPSLVEQYRFLINPKWKLLDFLVNTEDTIHKIVRFHQGVTPPRLLTQRSAEDTVTISYNSPRRMCTLLKGIVKGAAAYYKEPVTILESRCMLKGDSECLVSVRLAAEKAAPEPPFKRAAGA
jgi:hypothetical protein